MYATGGASPKVKNQLEGAFGSPLLRGTGPHRVESDLLRVFHQGLSLEKRNVPLSSGNVSLLNDPITDWSTFMREVFGFSPVCAGSTATPAMGLSSSINIPAGGLGIYTSYLKAVHSDEIGYENGSLEGRVGIAKSTFQLAGGVGFTAARGLSIGSIFAGSAGGVVSPVLANAAFWTTSVSMALFALYFIFIIVCTGIQMYNRHSFMKELDSIENIDEKLAYLQSKISVNVTSQEFQNEINTFDPEDLIQKGQKFGVESLRAFIKVRCGQFGEELQDATDLELEELLEDLLTKCLKEDGVKITQEHKNEFYKMLGTSAWACIVQERKDLELNGYLGAKTVNEVKALVKSLDVPLVEGKKTEVKETIFNKISESAKSENWKQVVLIGIVVLGVIAMLSAIALTGPLAPIIVAGLFIAMGITMLALDIYYLYTCFDIKNIGKYDEAMAKISIAIGVTAVVVSFVTMSFFSFGALPIIMTLVIGIPWIISQSALLYKIREQKEELRGEEELWPQLPKLKEALSAEIKEDHAKTVAGIFYTRKISMHRANMGLSA